MSDKLHTEVLSKFDKAYSTSQEQRDYVTEQRRFVDVKGAQWEGSTNAGYSLGNGRFDNYPRFELNKLARECGRIVSEYRNNRISVRFRPSDDKASEAISELLAGKYRADWEDSSGGDAADTAFDSAVKGGFGCIRLDTEWEDELDLDNKNQRIVFRPVMDAERTVWFDPDSKEADKSDATWALEMYSMTPSAFKSEWPKADLDSMLKDTGHSSYDWCSPDVVYVGRYYEVRVERTTLYRYTNPITNMVEEYDEASLAPIKDELESGPFELVSTRAVKRRNVYCGLMSGCEWLEEPTRIQGEYIPLVPVYGHRTVVDGIERLEGHVGKAMDAQRLENLMVSMIADNATQAGGDNIPIVDVEMIPSSMMGHWAERNKKRPAFLPMTSVKDARGNIVAPASVLGYTQPTPLSPALAGLLGYTSGAIQQITGASQMENIPSNIAMQTVDSIFNRMDNQSYIYMDNMAKAMRQCGKVWMSIAREVYGSIRTTRIVREDGTDEMVLLQSKVVDNQSNKAVALNDLTVGRYEITVDVGHSFATRRDSTVRTLSQMLTGVPADSPYYPVLMGMIIDNMDGEGISELKDYNRNQMLLSGVVKPRTPEEEQMVMSAQQAAGQQADPAMVAAMAADKAATAEVLKAQNSAAKNEIDAYKAQSQGMVNNSTAALNMAKAEQITKDEVDNAMALLNQYMVQQASYAGRMI